MDMQCSKPVRERRFEAESETDAPGATNWMPTLPRTTDVKPEAVAKEEQFLADAAWVQENWGDDNESEEVADSEEEDWSLAPGIGDKETARSKACAERSKIPIGARHASRQLPCATDIRDSAENCPEQKGSVAGRITCDATPEENLPSAPVKKNRDRSRSDGCVVKTDSSKECSERAKIPNGSQNKTRVDASNIKNSADVSRSQKVRVNKQQAALEVQAPLVVAEDEAEKGTEEAGAEGQSRHRDAEDLRAPSIAKRKGAETERGFQHSTLHKEVEQPPSSRRKVRFTELPEVVNIESSVEVVEYQSSVAKLRRENSSKCASWGLEVEDTPEDELVLTGIIPDSILDNWNAKCQAEDSYPYDLELCVGDFITAVNGDSNIENMKISLSNMARKNNYVTFERRPTDKRLFRKRQAWKNTDCEDSAGDSERIVRSSEDDCSEVVEEKKTLQTEDLHGDVESAEDTDSERATAQGVAEPPDVVETAESKRAAKAKSCPQHVRASPSRACAEPRIARIGRTWCAKHTADTGASSSHLGKRQPQSAKASKKHTVIWECTSCRSLVKRPNPEDEEEEDDEEEGFFCEPCWEAWESSQFNTDGAEEEDEISAFLLSISHLLMALQGEELVPALERIAERLAEDRPAPLAVERVAIQMWSYIPKDVRLSVKRGSGLLRYKSSLCHAWFERGSCTNARCTFAHGTSELTCGPAWQRLAVAAKAMHTLCQQNAF